MVRICDAIMGSGKTSAAISYINSHPERKYLYVAPYNDEAARIGDACPDADFYVLDSDKMEYKQTVTGFTVSLIDKGRSIASTHQAMRLYTPDTIRALKQQGYTVIIDEEVSVLEKLPRYSEHDMRLLEKSGYVTIDSSGVCSRTDKLYSGGTFGELFKVMDTRPVVVVQDSPGSSSASLLYARFPSAIFTEVDDVIIITYMFEGSEMNAYLDMIGAEYELIGVRRGEHGEYEFGEYNEYIPEYAHHLGDMIHIECYDRLNKIGANKTALSKGWYDRNPDKVDQVRKNLINFFCTQNKGSDPRERMFGYLNGTEAKIRSKGFYRSGVVFNQRSTNDYRDKTVLAYPVNIFLNVGIKLFYQKRGTPIDEDRYALAIMIQWIWRSAIRDGEKINLYLPSKRMRNLLIDWMDSLAEGGEEVA